MCPCRCKAPSLRPLRKTTGPPRTGPARRTVRARLACSRPHRTSRLPIQIHVRDELRCDLRNRHAWHMTSFVVLWDRLVVRKRFAQVLSVSSSASRASESPACSSPNSRASAQLLLRIERGCLGPVRRSDRRRSRYDCAGKCSGMRDGIASRPR